MGDTLTAYMPMKTYSTTLLLCGLLCLAVASAHRCGCSHQRRARDSLSPKGFWTSDDFDFFSSSTINNLATLRKNAALGQRALGTPRMYSQKCTPIPQASWRRQQSVSLVLGQCRAQTRHKDQQRA